MFYKLLESICIAVVGLRAPPSNVPSNVRGCATRLNMPHSSFKTRAQVLVVNTYYGLKVLFYVVNSMMAIQLFTRVLAYEPTGTSYVDW